MRDKAILGRIIASSYPPEYSQMSKLISPLFTEHPASVGETYFEHLRAASGFSLRLIVAGLACFIHGLLPFLFVSTGKKTLIELHDIMVVNRDQRQRSEDRASSDVSKSLSHG